MFCIKAVFMFYAVEKYQCYNINLFKVVFIENIKVIITSF